jgi:hypothetical protein
MHWNRRFMTGRSQRNSSAQQPRKSVSIHSIHGSTCGSWNRSVGGSSGDSYDNTMAESIIRFYKTEVIRPHGPWKSIDSVEIATLTELVGAIARARPCIPGLLVQQPADHGTDRISLFERSGIGVLSRTDEDGRSCRTHTSCGVCRRQTRTHPTCP